LKGYISFWGWAFTAVTLAIALFKQEEDHLADSAAAAAVAAVKSEDELVNGSGDKGRRTGSKGSGSEAADAQCLLTNGNGTAAAAAAAVMAEAGGGDDWSSRWREIRAAYVQLWEVVSLVNVVMTSRVIVTDLLGELQSLVHWRIL
jgi:hypothetical protein